MSQITFPYRFRHDEPYDPIKIMRNFDAIIQELNDGDLVGGGGDGSGESWFSGAGVPAGALGEVGDWYLNSTNGDYYEKTDTSTWTLRGNLRGPAGPQGPAGPTGPTGATGQAEQWHSGPDPPAGALGNVGDWYLETDTGYVSEKTGASTWTNRAWIMGPTGAQGVPGDDGLPGEPGPEGPQGPQGPQGVQGPQGETGPEGPMGPAGTVYDTDQIGTIKTFAGTVIPTNWMLADGRAMTKTQYPELHAALGIAAGTENFNLPDLRNRFIYGASAPGVGATGGEATHLLTANESGMPVHGHVGRYNNIAVAGGGSAMGSVSGPYGDSGNQLVLNSGSLDASAAHNNLPPYVLIAQIIKVTGVQIDPGGALVGPQGPIGPTGPEGDPGPAGAVEVYEQPADPGGATGAIWIDTDAVPPAYVSNIPLVTSLPASPTDGQEIYFQSAAMATLGIVWHLRYRAVSASAYKWEFIGGAYVRVAVDAVSTTTTTGQWIDLATPTFALPLAGEYAVRAKGHLYHSVAGGVAWFRCHIGNTVSPGLNIQPAAANYSSAIVGDLQAVDVAGAVVKTQVHNSTAGTLGVQARSIEVTPVRVG